MLTKSKAGSKKRKLSIGIYYCYIIIIWSKYM